MRALECKRVAIQIVAQLPPDSRDALAVLNFSRELVEKWLSQSAEVLEFREALLGSSPRAVAIVTDIPAELP